MILAILRVIGRRLLAIVPVFAVVTVLIFGALRILPVDPAQMSLPPSATIEQVEAKREAMGLNRPVWEQYAIWAKGAVAGDLGDPRNTACRPSMWFWNVCPRPSNWWSAR
ncbi:hypothetical protein ACFQFQ_26405 [Sulfitobacter porphyrae]|uniref:ABC transporter type 1 GsiC-like N-terminal domain-containing protein n=1 Tax=Sulfitobacter porphyrae TaxID=1246864 RepID=A0ABW2B930_9RHOB